MMEARIRAWLDMGQREGRFVKKLSDIIPDPTVNFKVGDIVTYTNEAGIRFPNRKIIAIGKHNDLWQYGHCVHLDKDSFWYPVKPSSLSFD